MTTIPKFKIGQKVKVQFENQKIYFIGIIECVYKVSDAYALQDRRHSIFYSINDISTGKEIRKKLTYGPLPWEYEIFPYSNFRYKLLEEIKNA